MMSSPGYNSPDSLSSSQPSCGSSMPSDGLASSTTDDGGTQDPYLDQPAVCRPSSDLSCSSCPSLDSPSTLACTAELPPCLALSSPCYTDTDAPVPCRRQKKRRKFEEKEEERADGLRHQNSLSSRSSLAVSHPSCSSGEDWRGPPCLTGHTSGLPLSSSSLSLNSHLPTSSSSSLSSPPPALGHSYSTPDTSPPPCSTPDGTHKENPSSPHILGTSSSSSCSSSSSHFPFVSAFSSSGTSPRTSFSSETASPVLPHCSSPSTPPSVQKCEKVEGDSQAQAPDRSVGVSSAPLPCPSFLLPSEIGSSTQTPPPDPHIPHPSASHLSPCSLPPPSFTLPSCSCCSPPCSSTPLSFAQKIIRQVLLRCSTFFASLQLLPCCCPLPLHPLLNPLEVANLHRILTLIELSSGGGPCQYAGGGKRPGRQGGQVSKVEHHSTPLSDSATPSTPPRTGDVAGPRERQHEKTRRKEGKSHPKEREVSGVPEGLRNEETPEIQLTSHQDEEEEIEVSLSKVDHQGEAADEENIGLWRNNTYDSSRLIEEEREKEKFPEESQSNETTDRDVVGTDGKEEAGIVSNEFDKDSGKCVANRYCHEGSSCVDDMTDFIDESVGDERLSETSSYSPHLPRKELPVEQPSIEMLHDDRSKKRTQPVRGVEEEKKTLRHEEKEEEETEGKTEEEVFPRRRCDSSTNSHTERREQEGLEATERVAEGEDNRSGEEKPLVITNATELFEDGSGVGRQRTLHWLRRTLREEMTNPNVEGFLLYLRRPSCSSSSFHFVACARLEIIEDGDASLSWLLLPKGLSKESEEELLLSFFVYVICIYLLVMPYKLRPGIDALHPVLTPLMLLQKKELLLEAERRRKAELTKTMKNTERKKGKRKKEENEKEVKTKDTQGKRSGEPEGEKEATRQPPPPEVQAALLCGTPPPTEKSNGQVERERPMVEQRGNQDERKMMMSDVSDEVREGNQSKIVGGAVSRTRCAASTYPEIPDVLRLPAEIYETIEGENEALFGDDRIFSSTSRLGEGNGQADEHLQERELVGSDQEKERIDANDGTHHSERSTLAEKETADKSPDRRRTDKPTRFSGRTPLSTSTAEALVASSSPSFSCTPTTLTSCLPSSLPLGSVPSTPTDGPPSYTSTSFSSSFSSEACCMLPQANASELPQCEDDQAISPEHAAKRGQQAGSRQDLGLTQRDDDSTLAYLDIRDADADHGENIEGISLDHDTMRRGMLTTFQLLLRSLVPLPKEPNLHCRLTVDCGDLLLCPRPLLHLLDKTPFCRGGLAHREPDNSEVPKDIRLHQQISFHLYHLIPLRNPQAYGCKPWYKSRGSRRPRGGGRVGSGVKKSARNEGNEEGRDTGEKEETASSSVLENIADREGRNGLEQNEGGTKDVREARRQLTAAISSGCVFHSHISNAGKCCCQVQGAWPLRLFMFHAKELVLKIFPLLLAGPPSPSDATSVSQTPCLSSFKGDPLCDSLPSSLDAATPDIFTQPSCTLSSCPASHSTRCHTSSSFTERSAAAYKPKGYSTMRLPFTPSPQLQAELQRILGVKGAGPSLTPGAPVVPTSPNGVKEVSGVHTPPPPSHFRQTNAHKEDIPESTERDSFSSRMDSPQGRLPTPTPPGGKVTASDVITTSLAQQGSSHQHLQQQLTEKLWSTAKVETFEHPQDTAIRACEEQAAHTICAAFQEFHTLIQRSGMGKRKNERRQVIL